MFGEDIISKALVGLPVIIFSLTVHEFSHAWSAYRFGDSTARDMGRMTLNPLAHLDFMGVIVMVASQFTFGWAKPVPVNPMNLRNPRVADIWISAAGPISNLCIAFLAAMVVRMINTPASTVPPLVFLFLETAVWINVTLAVFNLIPLFPLDGSHILRNLLPESYGGTMDTIDRVAPFLLLMLLIFGVLWIVIGPIVVFIVQLLRGF